MEDRFGIVFITGNNKRNFYGYYSIIREMQGFLYSKEWESITTSWYINSYGTNFDSVRISYFCKQKKDPLNVLNKFISNSALSLIEKPLQPKDIKISAMYGGEELRFRNYLSHFSRIGLDLINDDLHYAQCLFSVFRWQIFIWGGHSAGYFEPSFKARSPYYNTMSDEDKKQFLDDLNHWPNSPQVDWAHMFVDMILGVDWFRLFKTTQLNAPLPIDRINDILNGLHIFKIPKDWEPDDNLTHK